MRDQPQSSRRNQTHQLKIIPESISPQDILAVTTQPSKDLYVYRDTVAHKEAWMTEKKLSKLSDEMTEWAQSHPEATKLEKFFRARGIRMCNVDDWRKKWPWFQADYETAKGMIGDRREDGGLTRAYDPGIVRFTMPMYDEEWVKESERVALLSKDEKAMQGSQALTVIMQDFANLPRIKEEKK